MVALPTLARIATCSIRTLSKPSSMRISRKASRLARSLRGRAHLARSGRFTRDDLVEWVDGRRRGFAARGLHGHILPVIRDGTSRLQPTPTGTFPIRPVLQDAPEWCTIRTGSKVTAVNQGPLNMIYQAVNQEVAIVTRTQVPGVAAQPTPVLSEHDNQRALDLIENAARSTPYCGCGSHMSAAEHDGQIWLECAEQSLPKSGLSGLFARITSFYHTRQMIMELPSA
jgi:hypothetical protein